MHHNTACLNCGTTPGASTNFCPHCGERTHQHRLNLSHVGHSLVHVFTHADKGIFYLVRMVTVRPGTVICKYIGGRRKKYFNPLNFFFIAVGLFVFLQTTFKPMNVTNMEAARKQVARIPNKTTGDRQLARLERAEVATDFMGKNSNYVNMGLTPFVALIFYFCFIRAGYNYTEYLIVHLYLAGFNALFYILFITPCLLLAKGIRVYFYGIFAFLPGKLFTGRWPTASS